MKQYILYHFDLESGEFLYAKEPQKTPDGQPILDVLGATHVEPLPHKEGKALKWTGKQWIYSDDHRQKVDEYGAIIPGTGTPYWLPGDEWNTPPRFMTTIGKLPKNALLSSPQKPKEQVKKDEMYRLGMEMLTLENEAIRYAHEITLAQLLKEKPKDEDVEKFKEIRASISELREQYRNLKRL